MHSNKLVTILSSLDRKTFLRLEKFIQHPYFIEVKQRQKILDLFLLLQKHFPHFQDPDLSKAKVFAQLFPGQDFAVEKLDKIITRLLKVVRVFIVYEFADPEERKTQQLLGEAKYYRERAMNTYFLQSIQQLQRQQKKTVQRGQAYFYTSYLIDREVSEFETLFNKRKEGLNLQNTHESLDVFYLASKLEYACLMLAQHQFNVPLEVKESLQLLEKLLPLIETIYAPKEPIIDLFYQAFDLLKNKEEPQKGEKLRYLLDKYDQLIPFEQLINVEAIYRSYCIREFNLGHLSSQDLFDLYRKHLEKGYLFRRGGLQPGLVKNLVNLGLKQKSHDWVWRFLQNYKDKIVGTDFPEEVYLFNLANYHFSLGAYEKVLESLQEYREDTYYKVAAKRLELKVYYEQKSPILESKMDAFKVYLFRVSKKILSISHQEGNNNFINFLRQVCNPGTYKNESKINRILKKMEATSTMLEREWLEEKLKKLL